MSDDRKRDPFAPLPLSAALLPPRPIAPVAPPVEPLVEASTPQAGELSTDPSVDPSTEPGSAGTPVPPGAVVDSEPPLLPAAAPSLDEAVGVPARATQKARRSDDDDGDPPRRGISRLGAFVAALAIVGGAGIAALVLLGRVNSGKLVLTCGAESVSVERGRSFPPWGTRPIEGAEWAPVKLPPEAQCVPRETESRAELAGWFVKILEDRATALLTAKEVASVDEAEHDLKQALLVSRQLGSDDVRIDTRGRVERMLGDVTYWRASAKLAAAATALGEAAKEFDAAAAQKPRYVTDAAAWADHVRKLTTDLELGPAGAMPSSFLPVLPGAGPAPLGTELPVEPSAAAQPAAEPPAETPVPDGGAPSGGVLL